MKIDSIKIKEIMKSLGADLCGIANVERFDTAPEGFHPKNVLPACKSVIAFACRVPVGIMMCKSHTPYTRARNTITPKMDMIALDFCIEMEKYGVICVPVPTNESEWDRKTNRWRSIISLKHAAQAAGLGVIGRNTLLITPEFGSMIWLGAVLCIEEFEPDELKENICENCNQCVKVCPVSALDEVDIEQQKCWNFAFGEEEETQTWKISCHRCRDICLHRTGSINSFL